MTEPFQIFRQLRRPDGLAIVGGNLGSLLLALDEKERARQVLTDSHEAAIRIGLTDLAQQIAALLDQATEGDADQ
jgi:hypothetical protein